MPLQKVKLNPGFNQQATQTLNEGGFSFGNLVRFRYGLIQKIAGWLQLYAQPAAGVIRALHAYEDLQLNNTLLIGTDGGAQIYAGGELVTAPFLVGVVRGYGLSVSMGSKTVTAVYSQGQEFSPPAGAVLQLPQPIGVGGILLPTGTSITVLTASTGTFTFNLPVNATMNDTSIFGIPLFFFFFSGLSVHEVQLENHGLSMGSPFTVDLALFAQTTSSGGFTIDIAAGTVLTVASVIDANNFTFNLVIPSAANYTGQMPIGFYGGSYNLVGQFEIPGAQMQLEQTPPSGVLNWSVDNFGNFGLFCPANGPIYQYTPPLSANSPLINLGVNAPQINAGMFLAMPQAQIIAFGSEATIGGGSQDPLLLRWSDAGDQTNFIASATNQAGSFRLSRGSKIVGGIQAPQSTFIWTDVDLWSMAYIGFPLVYSFTIVSSGCGLLAAHACVAQGASIYWMSQKQFWSTVGGAVTPLECPLWDYVFPDLDPVNSFKCFAASNAAANEIMFFFPSLSGGTGECDSYVKYNTLEQVWDPGRLVRTSWIDQSVFGGPLGSDLGLLVQQHEVGYDANGQPMTGAYFETGFFDIGDGDVIPFVKNLIPDLKWIGAAGGYVTVTLWGANEPGEAKTPTAPTMYGPWTVTSGTNEITLGDGVRKRQIAFRVDWGAVTGFGATLGAPRFRISPAGKRP